MVTGQVDQEIIMSRADTAMYQAKERGGTSTSFMINTARFLTDPAK